MSPLIDAREAARLMSMSTDAVYLLAAPAGPIPCFRFGRAVRFDPAEIHKYKRVQRLRAGNRKPRYDEELAAIAARAVSLPARCGIYFLFHKGHLVYVGQAINIARRIGQQTQEKEFDQYSFIECDPSELNRMECLYIQRYEPAFNKKMMPPPMPVAFDETAP